MAARCPSVRCRRWRFSESTYAVGLSPDHSSKRGSTPACWQARAVAAVEDLALVEHDRLQESVLADVLNKFAELGAVHVHEREEGGGRVEFGVGKRRALVGG
jgi:hypothetical protein